MVSHVGTVALTGIAATPVDVQVQISPGIVGFTVVGLPDNAVKESRERVRSSLHALGLSFPAKRITVNLSPADLLKEGSHYDVPVAIALLITMGILPQDAADGALFLGELGLDGTLAPVPGCLPAAIEASARGLRAMYVPTHNAPEAAWAGNISVYGATTLKNIMQHLTGEQVLKPTLPQRSESSQNIALDIADVRGQEQAKRVLEIAAAGGHNLLMSGPPGSGKSMLARRLAGLLPPLSSAEALEVSMVHSVAGTLNSDGLLTTRPFRDPHHSASSAALCGGGLKAKPGEISLAHRGVLFLDELPEFDRDVLETLRQPLETGNIAIARANRHVTYPARFQLVAAMNPCPCGYLGDVKRGCSKQPRCAENYQTRLSGPLLDRIDLHVQVPAVDIKDLSLPPAKENSAQIAVRVAAARDLQKTRTNGRITCNAELEGKLLDEVCATDTEAEKLLHTAAERFGLSARAYHRTLKVARTIADLAGSGPIQKPHVAEAIGYRKMNMV